MRAGAPRRAAASIAMNRQARLHRAEGMPLCSVMVISPTSPADELDAGNCRRALSPRGNRRLAEGHVIGDSVAGQHHIGTSPRGAAATPLKRQARASSSLRSASLASGEAVTDQKHARNAAASADAAHAARWLTIAQVGRHQLPVGLRGRAPSASISAAHRHRFTARCRNMTTSPRANQANAARACTVEAPLKARA